MGKNDNTIYLLDTLLPEMIKLIGIVSFLLFFSFALCAQNVSDKTPKQGTMKIRKTRSSVDTTSEVDGKLKAETDRAKADVEAKLKAEQEKAKKEAERKAKEALKEKKF